METREEEKRNGPETKTGPQGQEKVRGNSIDDDDENIQDKRGVEV